MKRSRFSEEQIIGLLKDHQAGMSATARRAWRRDAGQGILGRTVGLRPGLAPSPPANSQSGVNNAMGKPTGGRRP